ncbi:hypothetical protein, partial [Streptomyces sp. NPDC059802]|uniref:hypothetical protein n=1 Tax=Streptomyces sp. NPDC059802 TaxID=3346952 RepID=UPI003660B8C7
GALPAPRPAAPATNPGGPRARRGGGPPAPRAGGVWGAGGAPAGPAPRGSVNLCGKSAGITVGDAKGYFGAALTGVHTEN